MINFKNKDLSLIQQAIADAGHIFTSDGNGNLIFSDELAIQAIIDALPDPMPNLLPVQFHIMLNKSKLRDAIDALLPILKTEDIDKHDYYKAYLDYAQHYEFEMAINMFNDIREKFIGLDESLNFSDEQLRAMWLEAS